VKQLLYVSIAIMFPLGVAACGGDDDTTPQTDAAAGATTPPADSTAEANDADVVFAQSMIPHHQQAVEMAEIALDPTVGASQQVVDLATRVQQAQDPEIERMTSWLTMWDEPMQMDESGGHDMPSMDGTMSAEDMDALGMARGAEFDRMWMERMIAHHQGAISMAQTVQAEGSNPDVMALAAQIINAQQAEIDEMNTLLAG
jgi:uncharacterized protein (DUF305 family)